MTIYKAARPDSRGVRAISFKETDDCYIESSIPCGQCIGCRLDKSRTWAARLMHENQMHDESYFITLTLSDDNLTINSEGVATLNPRDLELFWKRWRKNQNQKLRYYAVGEYGDTLGRPHYHAIVFGMSLNDLSLHTTKDGINLYTSKTLDSEWQLGNTYVGRVTFESCAYVARYVVKKLTGNLANLYELDNIVPEFARMSRRPGIGSTWYDKYSIDIFPSDSCTIRDTIKIKPPTYYYNKLKESNPSLYQELKSKREDTAFRKSDDNTPRRLNDKMEVKLHQLKQLLRSFQ